MKPYAGRLADDSDWERAFMDRLTRMYERDKQHVCVIGWSLGNEAGYGRVHDMMARWIRGADSTRVVFYEPATYGPRAPVANLSVDFLSLIRDILFQPSILLDNEGDYLATDVLCPMYGRISDCCKLTNLYSNVPLILCEYAHMMGNSGGNLADYWRLFKSHPRAQGGFIWDWVDQGLSVPEAASGGSRHIWAYGGDFGEVEMMSL